MYLLGQGKQRKNKQIGLHQLKSFPTAQEINKMKREFTVWENIFANDTVDMGLISKVYKEPIQHKEDEQSNYKWAKGPE